MSGFRNTIAAALAQPYCANAVSFHEASSVLAMPEMQAIRATLLHFANVCCWTRDDALTNENRYRHLVVQGVPESVIAWVLEGEA